MIAAIVIGGIVLWILAGLAVARSWGRAASRADRLLEAQTARWLADKQHERAGDAWERRVLSDLVLGEWDWPE